MSRLNTILNPQADDSQTLRAERVLSLRSSPSSPTSSASETSHSAQVHQETKEHCAHPTCPDALHCLPDTDGRPQHTLPVILRCAILGSKKKRLTIREIYAAMEEKYPYYRTAGSTWKQSVRHHLSLNRLFERQPRPVTDPGFGSYWTVNLEAPPGTKRPRKRGRPQREVTGDKESAPAKKRGRPRKVPEKENGQPTGHPRVATLPVPSEDHMNAYIRVSATRTDCHCPLEDEDEEPTIPSGLGAQWHGDEDFESEDDGDEPQKRPTTPAYDRAVDMQLTPSPSRGSVGQLQDDSVSDAFPGDIIDHLKTQVGTLRRQASEARSEAELP
ncbi:hypothetical protein B0F90DRAFT_1678800 [Multifurca ochricompacta]|uniref:Fork-head domain-containing protein n=1 Tax=Multifurca ochricompacta TaxID=376703 RepID=A0AAD4MCP8_9AGAM|nr:hypothetical protein B0F90DRAFT_1678800 [Multifurca ochricompacta]